MDSVTLYEDDGKTPILKHTLRSLWVINNNKTPKEFVLKSGKMSIYRAVGSGAAEKRLFGGAVR